MMKPRATRRAFLRTGGVLLALPGLEALARNGAPPNRIVCINTAFGLYGPAFFPKADGTDYAPSEYLEVLKDLRNHFTVCSGISHPDIGGDHASEACFLTSAKHPRRPGFRNSVSMDYLAGGHVGSATRFPLLSLSTDNAGGMTFSRSGARLRTEYSPSRLYAAMFLAGSKNQVEKEIAALRKGRSVLDRMGDRLDGLKRRVGPGDRRQLADYTESVREMEKRLHANEEWVRKPKPKVTEPRPEDNPNKADIIGRTRLMYGLIRLALQTDSTRVCSLFIRGMDLTPPIEGVRENHHGLTHHGRNPAKIRELKLVEIAQLKAFRDLLVSLRDTRDGGSSLLDRTQVLLGSNLGDASGHGTTNLPILLAGGGWRHGRHIAGDVRKNTPLCNLFVSMMQRFGMKVDAFGSATGTLKGLE